jgi:hypothetical protein
MSIVLRTLSEISKLYVHLMSQHRCHTSFNSLQSNSVKMNIKQQTRLIIEFAPANNVPGLEHMQVGAELLHGFRQPATDNHAVHLQTQLLLC